MKINRVKQQQKQQHKQHRTTSRIRDFIVRTHNCYKNIQSKTGKKVLGIFGGIITNPQVKEKARTCFGLLSEKKNEKKIRNVPYKA